MLESPLASQSVLSSVGLRAVTEWLGGEVVIDPADHSAMVDVPYLSMLAATAMTSAIAIGVTRLMRRFAAQRRSFAEDADALETMSTTLTAAWRWWMLGGVLVLLDGILLIAGATKLEALLMLNAAHVISIALAGWGATLMAGLLRPFSRDPLGSASDATDVDGMSRAPQKVAVKRSAFIALCAAMLLYVVVFTAMNWQLYRTLMLPHGDSAMYEEHLWNVTHGKGFRSYLDQGLFFGEHIQVVHLLLLPLYALWPSHLLLELCQSVALAAGALPVFYMARRATGSDRIGCCVAVAYLLYPPMQFLDIAIDFKTFRPEAFVIPAYLFALDQFERRRLKTAALCLLIGLSAKEDYAIALAPFGVWWAVSAFVSQRRASALKPSNAVTHDADATQQADRATSTPHWLAGIGLVVFAVAYLLIATRIAMPYFRSGNELHYVRYFSKFGESFGEVVFNMLTSPVLVLSELTSAPSIVYLAAVFVPLGFAVFWSPGRALVSAPLLVLLCLNEVIQQDPFPRHHFQAPVVPLLFWAVTGALEARTVASSKVGQSPSGSSRWFSALWLRRRSKPEAVAMRHGTIGTSPMGTDVGFLAAFTFMSALLASVTAGQSPLGIRFWDAGSVAYWKANYIITRRAELIERVLAAIPQTARVASTDFVHPRLTHYERSYDYSHYPRAVANYEDRVPDDTDYIVIDTGHRYSDIKTPAQVRELRREPEKWELLDLDTEGVFIVLKRRR